MVMIATDPSRRYVTVMMGTQGSQGGPGYLPAQRTW